ncbi:4871_t:CDS:2 [Acaulospora colombiana]|uniref:4871_t:CDS:1 n=1 Tax=Acaulospora colombiana TaxID=27376 RepID=A0ACA9K7J9_9GLOM|nr:4871_t:CDS:2 [Acaulospora colombiana]
MLFLSCDLAHANIEKEVFSSNVDEVPGSIYREVGEWNMLTLTPPYTIQRYERVTPFRNLEEFSNALTGEKENWYILDGLEEGNTYEARVSYSATSPTTFVLEIMGVEDAARTLRKSPQDHEPTSESRVSTTKKLIRVRAIHAGVSIIPGRDIQPVAYNIVLETLTYGIPHVAFKLILFLGVTMGVAYFIFVPKIYKALRKVAEGMEREKKE